MIRELITIAIIELAPPLVSNLDLFTKQAESAKVKEIKSTQTKSTIKG